MNSVKQNESELLMNAEKKLEAAKCEEECAFNAWVSADEATKGFRKQQLDRCADRVTTLLKLISRLEQCTVPTNAGTIVSLYN